MKTSLLRQQLLIVCLLFAFLIGCATAAPETPTPSPGATLAPTTPTAVPPTLNAVAIALTEQVMTREVVTPIPTRTPWGGGSLDIEVEQDITYAGVSGNTNLDVFAPSQRGPWPIVIIVHSIYQSKSDFKPLAQAIAAEGAVVFNTNAPYHQGMFYPAVNHLACAVRYARAEAPDYGGDPDRIIIVGNSLGAVAGIVVGLMGDNFNSDCVVSEGSALPDGIVAYEGLYGFAIKPQFSELKTIFRLEGDLERVEAYDPYAHLGLNPRLQIRLIHGEDSDGDWWETRLHESTDMHRALVDAGYDVELIVVENSPYTALMVDHSKAFALTIQEVMELANKATP